MRTFVPGRTEPSEFKCARSAGEDFLSPARRPRANRAHLGMDTMLVKDIERPRRGRQIAALLLAGGVASPKCTMIAGSDHVDPAYADRLTAQITARGLAARVTLPRRSLSDAELKATYAAADVFVIQSERYAWGLAPLEAIASGTPVILTPGAGVHDVLAGRPGVQTVPARDPRATAEAIRRWRSGDGRQGIDSTRAWLREEYAFDRYVTRMEQIYADVLGADPRERVGSR
jgi:glycosyltransferase involved in cell wall biosynthesis